MDSIPLSTLFIILIACLVLSAYFSGSETGLLSLNKYRLRFLAEQGNKGAKKAEMLLAKPDKLLSFILIFNNLVNISASAIATVIGMRLYGKSGIALEPSINPITQSFCSFSLGDECVHQIFNAFSGLKTGSEETSH